LIGFDYSTFIKKQSATIRTIDFNARKALKRLPTKAGRTFDPRNGRFVGSAAQQAKQRKAQKKAIRATTECIKDSLESIDGLGGALGAVLFCGLAGVVVGAFL